MVDQQPPPGSTLTLGTRATPFLEKPPPEPPIPPPPLKISEANGLENPNRKTPPGTYEKKHEHAHITSLDEAHAPFMYVTKGEFNYNGTFSDAEDPKRLFINSAKLIISTLQGGALAPSEPSPNLLEAGDWADLSCALLAAIGRGYILQYDKDQADATLKKEWAEAPDPNPLSARYPTFFHRLSATADALNDQLLIDGQDDECNIDGWIAEVKIGILAEETVIIKAQVQEDWRRWRAAEFTSRAAAQEKDIADAVRKRNANYFLSAAAEFGLRPICPTNANPQPLQGPPGNLPRGLKRAVSGSAPSTEPTTPRKQKTNPPQDARFDPSPAVTPRGRAANPPAAPNRWADPSPTPQPKRGDTAAPRTVLNLSPKVTLNLRPKVSTEKATNAGQLDAATITAAIHSAVGPAIQMAMAPLATRIAALERYSMPPPIARTGPPHIPSEQLDQRTNTAPQANPPTPATQREGNFTLVSRSGIGKKGKGKADTSRPTPAPSSYAGAATAAANLPQPPPQGKGSTPIPPITEVTILRPGGLMDTLKETQIRNCAADAIVREVRLKMAKATANPIRLRAGRWSINPRSKGNFVYSFEGNVPFDTIKSYEHILLGPLGDIGELCPSMGWTRFLVNGVPVSDDENLPFGPEALLEEVRTLPGMKKVYFAMLPRWLTHPDRIYTTYSSVTFAISDPDGSISSTLINNRAALFGKEVTIRKWIDKPAFTQCSRCHALGHNKASRVCTLSQDSVKCHKCGGAHTSEEHDNRCPKKHAVAGICDCKRKCLNCHNFGHDCRDPRCPARDQYRPRTARKPRKGKNKVRPMELEDHPYYGGDHEHWSLQEEWNDDTQDHQASTHPPAPPPAPTMPTPPAAARTHTPPAAPAPTPTSLADSQIMNIDYEVVDPFTRRPAVYDDPFLQAEPPSAAAYYSPSHVQDVATPLAHD